MYIRVRGFPLNGIFGPCACLLAGGCGAWPLLARRRRRHSELAPLGGPQNRQNPQDTCSKIPGRVFSEGAEPPEAGHHPSHSSGELPPRGDLETGQNGNY